MELLKCCYDGNNTMYANEDIHPNRYILLLYFHLEMLLDHRLMFQ